MEAIWEKSSFKEKTWLLPHDCANEERNLISHIWKVCGTSTGMVSMPENRDWGMFASIPACHPAGPSPFTERACEGTALKKHMYGFWKIAAKTLTPNTYWQGTRIVLFLYLSILDILWFPTMGNKGFTFPHTFLTSSFLVPPNGHSVILIKSEVSVCVITTLQMLLSAGSSNALWLCLLFHMVLYFSWS